MNKKKKILFFGLGSIGNKHLKILKTSYDFDIYAYRSVKSNVISGVKNIYSLNEAFKIQPDIAFITNPTHLHIDTAINCLENGINNLFIEKPISHSLKNLDYLLKKIKELNSFVYIGYVLRFHPILVKINKIIKNKLKDVIYSRTICSSYLPKWRPNCDYRKIYSSLKEQGGGVILDLSHDIDYNQMLFGKIDTIKGFYGKLSNLEINSEDFCELIVFFKNQLKSSIHLNYFGLFNQRTIDIFLNNQEIIGDLINNKLIIIDENNTHTETFEINIDYLFKKQINYFINCIENENKCKSNLLDSIDLLKNLIEFKNKKNGI